MFFQRNMTIDSLRLVLVCFLLWPLLGDVGLARAEEGKSAEARASFERGKELFKEANYSEAADAFRKANSLHPNWRLLFNIGQSEAAAKRHGLALEAFESYLSAGGDDVPIERRDSILEEIAGLSKIVGSVIVKAPAGATVFIDDVNRGEAPLSGSLAIAASVDHRVWANVEQDITPVTVVRVRGGESREITLSLQPKAQPLPVITVVPVEESKVVEEAAPVEEIPSSKETVPGDTATEHEESAMSVSETDDENSSSPVRTVGWVGLGLGAAMMVGGGITGGMALSMDSELTEECSRGCPDKSDDLDSRDSLALTADILIIGGAAIAVVGVLMVVLGKSSDENDEGQLAIAPILGSDLAGAVVEWRY